MISTLKTLPDKTLELTITIPWSEVKNAYEKIMAEIVKNAEIKGFRKGKAPRKIVEEKADKNKVYSLALEELLPKFYTKAVQEQKLNPIVNPKVKVLKTEENKDWEVVFLTCEKPEVNLGDYKKEIKGEFAKEKIWVPGKNNKEPRTENQEQNRQNKFNKIIEILLRAVKVNLPGILVEDEMARLLSQTLDEIKRLGLTLDQYLASTGKTVEVLKQEAQEKAKNSLLIEFILEKVAEEEKITVENEEIEKAINENPDKNVQEALRKNSYLLASVIRRQKTLEFLTTL